jgi:hypothetical protein
VAVDRRATPPPGSLPPLRHDTSALNSTQLGLPTRVRPSMHDSSRRRPAARRFRIGALAATLGFGLLSGGVASAAVAHRLSVKPQILGLVDKSSQAPYVLRQPFPTVNPSEVARYAGAFSGIVVNETWAQLQPSRARLNLTPLRQSLAAVLAYNRAHPARALSVKLRLWGGFTAPGWAKTLGGERPLTFATPTATGTTGRWWTPAYRAAWTSFLHALAARYDGNSLIRSVAVSSCATLTAEPFVQSPSLLLHTELFAAGWSSAAQQRCLQGAFSDYSGWRRTPIDYTFNPFVSYTPGKAPGTRDPTFTNHVMAMCANLRRTTGRTCILSNHAFTATAPTISRSAPVYAEMSALYAQHPTLVDLQTGPPDNFGGCQAINVAISYHAQSLELWPRAANPKSFKGFSAYPKAELQSWAQALRAGKPLHC